MKILLAICMMVNATLGFANDNSAPEAYEATSVKGEVLEVKNVESYTYLRLKTEDGETWAAVIKAAVKPGDAVTIENASVMHDFESKTLKRTFPTIWFGMLRGAGGDQDGHVAGTAYPVFAKKAGARDVQVPKASGDNAHTVAEIMTMGGALKDQPVLVRGKVVKYNAKIMGKNWVHLRDGSGNASDNTNDVLVTTASEVKLGDVVTVKGIVRTDRDFGAGYAYKVLIEEATLE